MRAAITLFALVVALVSHSRATQVVQTTIEDHPEVVSVTRFFTPATWLTTCAGAILNNRAVLSASNCLEMGVTEEWRVRVGSTNWLRGGDLYIVSEIVLHHDWDVRAMMENIAVIRTADEIVFGSTVQPGRFSGPNYVVPFGADLLIAGWGYSSLPGFRSGVYEDLRETRLTNLNLTVCNEPYTLQGMRLNHDQLCIGFRNFTVNTVANDRCFGEPGAPVYLDGVIVGVRSYALSCGVHPEIPSATTRVSSYIQWITEVAEN